jgi:hypothetical protein
MCTVQLAVALFNTTKVSPALKQVPVKSKVVIPAFVMKLNREKESKPF